VYAPTEVEVLAAAGYTSPGKILSICKRWASDEIGRIDYSDLQEYVSVAAVAGCEGKGKTAKQAILDYLHGKYPESYGAGPDAYQEENRKGEKRTWRKFDVVPASQVAEAGSRDSALDYLVSQAGQFMDLYGQRTYGRGRTGSKTLSPEGGKGWTALPPDDVPERNAEPDGRWLDLLYKINPDKAAAFEALILGPRYPGAEDGWGRSQQHMAADLNISRAGAVKRAAPFLDFFKAVFAKEVTLVSGLPRPPVLRHSIEGGSGNILVNFNCLEGVTTSPEKPGLVFRDKEYLPGPVYVTRR
jgi:hypothetical protein